MKLFGAKSLDSRPVLYVVEPFNYLLKNWEKARVIGSTSKTDEALGLFAAGHVDVTNPLASLIRSPRPPVKAELLESTPLPLLGERRLFGQDRRTTSVVIGLPAETRSWVENTDVSDAETHGLLTLVVGTRSISSVSKETNQHSYLGTVLFEPSISDWSLPLDQPVLFLSILSPELLSYYWRQYFPDTVPEAVHATEILSASPSQAEWLLNKANVIGSATLRDRYQLLNLLDKRYRCRLFSSSVADKQLVESYQF